jgi:hypothetical protein
MPRKRGTEVKYPEKAHPTLTAEESHFRVLERQRERRARRKLEAGIGPHNGGLGDPGDQAVPIEQDKVPSKSRRYLYLSLLSIEEGDKGGG